MKTVDTDILAVLQTLAASGELQRVSKVKAKHERQAVDRLETQLELLSDELEAVMPRTHPLFPLVLMAVAIRKAGHTQEEPEYKSALEGFFVGDQT